MRTLLTVSLLLMLTISLPAQQTLDQEFDPAGAINFTTGIGDTQKAQTFTVGLAGQLTSLDVFVELNANSSGSLGSLYIDLLPTTAGVPEPVANSLFTATIPLSNIGTSPSWHSVDVSSLNLTVTPGDVYAIALTSDITIETVVSWKGSSGGTGYPGGGQFFTNPTFGITNWTATSGDGGFRTFVDVDTPIVLTDTQGHFEDFESGGSTDYAADNGLWELGTPAQPFINQAFSGSNCWMTDLDGFYPASSLSGLVSPWFDCSALTSDPVVSFQITWNTFVWNDGARLEIDLDDGQGWRALGDTSFYDSFDNGQNNNGLTGVFWGGGTSAAWHQKRHAMTGAAGQARVRFRILFGSDSIYGSDGFAIDDVRVESSAIVVDAAQPYFQDFETPDDAWKSEFNVFSGNSTASGPIWERGTPTQPAVAPWSGLNCLATDLDSSYPVSVLATMTSPPIDCSALSSDPFLELALWHDLDMNSATGGNDGVRVEVDRNDGSGFQTLGSIASWYDAGLSNNTTVGGIGWTGQSNGWRFPQHRITGAAGQTGVRVRLVFSSNIGSVATGALVDDIRIFAQTFPGTESILSDDLRMQTYIDGKREVGTGDAYTMTAGQQVEMLTLSSEGHLVGGEYYLVCEVFPTGSTYVNTEPDVWISLTGSSLLLDGGVQAPFFVPRQLGPYGESHVYFYGGGVLGLSCRVQAIVFNPAAANGIYASSDAFELKFN